MEEKSQCPRQGGRGSKLTPSAIQPERERERRRLRAREQNDAVSSTPDRAKRDEASGVPCKVPRFQYVDFPSLHQCIQQLSVPPLESWLSGCHTGRPTPGLAPAGPKERAPKFKYVDYPSLYHCIQQLSVPPLESWSSALPQPRSGDGGGARTVAGNPSQIVMAREDQATQTAPSDTSDVAHKQEGSLAMPFLTGELAERSNPGPNAPSNKPQKTAPPHILSSTGTKTRLLKGSFDQGPSLSATTDYYSGPVACSDTDRTSSQLSLKATRPSVISLHPGKETLLKRPQGPPAGCPDLQQVARSTWSGSVCPLCQKMFSGPEELREHQENH
ncbi:uncharacterized protein si:ch211-284e13.6 [Clupea harengus]|uniref:Uncharacterized protein si:ch211-284e13.6 n=1 Tax=Clupea harengus TaxID=7950 RepID=A0A6P3W5P0_CLUHA|nr:uncharacterized protein si:ch211-284e13.6 [Clupea harengus]XP_012690279.2 uncharacterized protein si:ch211-284e13.6 [Clupea harengus]